VVAFVPEANVGIVVLSNLGGTDVPEILAQWFFDRYLGAPDKDWNQIVHAEAAKSDSASEVPSRPAKPSPPLPLSTYAGTYRNDVHGELAVRADDDALSLTIGPTRSRRPCSTGIGTRSSGGFRSSPASGAWFPSGSARESPRI
jgi:hypothetical protein